MLSLRDKLRGYARTAIGDQMLRKLREKSKMLDWFLGSTGLALLAGIFAIASTIMSSREDAADKAEQIRLLNALNDANQKFQTSQDQLVAAQTELNDAQKQLNAGLKDTLDHFTGGESILYFKFPTQTDGRTIAEYAVDGKHPVPNPHIEVIDIMKGEKLLADGKSQKEALAESVASVDMNSVWPDSNLFWRHFPFADSDETRLYEVLLSYGARKYAQFVAITPVKDQAPAIAYQVYRSVSRDAGKSVTIEKIPHLRFIDPRLKDSKSVLKLIDEVPSWKPFYRFAEPK